MPPSRLARSCSQIQAAWPWSQRHPTIGLDIGDEALTFIELQHRQGRYHVGRWGVERLDPTVIEHGRIKNRPALVSALRSFVEQYKLNGCSVAMAVNGASAIVKRIHVPTCSHHDLENYVLWEGAQSVPYDPDEVYLDFFPCSLSVPVTTVEGKDLLLVAAKREAVDERRAILEEVTLHPIICDVEALAFLNLVFLHDDIQPYSSYIIANLRSRMITIAVVTQGEPLLVRDVSFSPFPRQTGVAGTPEKRSQHQWSDDAHRAAEEPSVSQKISWFDIVSELNRTVEGAREEMPGLDIEKVFLCGRVVAQNSLQEECGKSLLVPVAFIEPLASLGLQRAREDVQHVAPFADVAGGLALRACQGR